MKANVLIAQIIEEEHIEVSDEEVDAEVKKLAEQYKMEEDKVKEYLTVDSLKSDLAYRKAVQLIADSAVPVAPKADETAEEEKAEPAAEETKE